MKILIQDTSGVRPLQEGYASEEELQTFLRQHPDLLPREEIDLIPLPLMCIGWEVRLASGAEDILYLDAAGLLTVVETKLRRNPESRREVVGQILEYAAHMADWNFEDVEHQAESFFATDACPSMFHRLTLSAALDVLSGGNANAVPSYEEFRKSVQENIDNGRFRLLIAIDEPPPALLKTVEFVNRFSQHFEMYLVQLKRFADTGQNQNIFVPALFGKVGVTQPERHQWDEERFFKHVRDNNDQASLNYIQRVFDAFKLWTDEPLYGSGTTLGSFNLIAHLSDGRRANFAQITTRGDLYVNFGNLHSRGSLGQEVIGHLYSDLTSIPGVRFPEDVNNRYPPIPKPVLRDPHKLEQILDALKSALDFAKASG